MVDKSKHIVFFFKKKGLPGIKVSSGTLSIK